MPGRLSRRKLAGYVADAADSKEGLAVALRDVAAYLIDSRRLREVDLVVRAIEDEFAARGVVIARVAATHPLTAELRGAVQAIVGAKEVHITESINPELIGGVRIETPGKLLDATIKRKLLALRQAKM